MEEAYKNRKEKKTKKEEKESCLSLTFHFLSSYLSSSLHAEPRFQSSDDAPMPVVKKNPGFIFFLEGDE